MKFDRFLAALFSRKSLILILIIVISVSAMTSCQLTCDDVISIAIFGCPSFDTCRAIIWECGECADCGDSCVGNCIGEGYNSMFGCVWESGLKDCRPSKICDSCGSDEEDYYESSTVPACDSITPDCIDIIDSIVN